MLQAALKKEYQKRCQGNPNYSVRSFAQSLGINSGSLTQILNGTRPIGPRVAKKLLNQIEISGNEKHQYINQLLGQPSTEVQQQDEKSKRQLHEDEIELISSWEHFAILSLLETNLPKSLVSIANKFGLPIGQCRQSLERLSRLGLIKQEGGKWALEKEDLELETTHDIPNYAIRNAHKQYIDLAKQSIDFHHVEDREIIGATLAIDPKQLPKAKTRIREFIQELSQELSGNNKEEVYRINLQLFPCGKSVTGKRRN